jgi:mannose-6-phosphate isomerase-like protein (cupin superfamily)
VQIGEPSSAEFFIEVTMSLTRRQLFSNLPPSVAAGSFLMQLLSAGATADDGATLPSTVLTFEELQVHKSNNAEIRPVLKGKLATGESLEVHETVLPPGGAPHAAHHHKHSEMWLIREGTVEIKINGKAHRLGAGSVAFVHSDEEHGVTNPGETPASYFVVAIGPGAA